MGYWVFLIGRLVVSVIVIYCDNDKSLGLELEFRHVLYIMASHGLGKKLPCLSHPIS